MKKDINQRKLELIQLILETKEQSVIEKLINEFRIKNIIESSEIFLDMNIKESIKRAEEDISLNRLFTNEEVLKEIGTWKRK